MPAATARMVAAKDVVRIDAHSARIGDATLAHDQIADVSLNVQEAPFVLVKSAERAWLVKCASMTEVDAVLEALGRSARSTVLVSRIATNLAMFDVGKAVAAGGLVMLFVALAAWFIVGTWGSLGTAGVYATLLPLVALLSASRVRIGIEGLAVSWFSLQRLYRWHDIASIGAHEDSVLVTLRSGRMFEISPEPTEAASVVIARIQASFDASRLNSADDDGAQLLARAEANGRRVAALRELGREDYRHQSVVRERLLGMVNDPTRDTITRARAAVALSGSPDETIRAHIRVAATAVAAPKLRVAWNALTSDDDTRVEAALSQIENEEATSSRRANRTAR